MEASTSSVVAPPPKMPSLPSPSSPPLPRVLILDYHDSYTNNLLTLFTELYPSRNDNERLNIKDRVHVIEWDDPRLGTTVEQALSFIKQGDYDCLILSPGPGRPDNPSDVGYLLELIHALPGLPILGVCLGMQALAVAYGAKIGNVPEIRHGHVIDVKHSNTGLFQGLATGNGSKAMTARMVSYNSLMVIDLPPSSLEILATSDADSPPRTQIQALRHRSLPHMGVQFHPESIESRGGGGILRNFLEVVQQQGRGKANGTRDGLKGQTKLDGGDREFERAAAAPLSSSSGADQSGQDMNPSSRRSDGQPRSAPPLPWRIARQQLALPSSEESTAQIFDRLFRSHQHPLGEIWLDGESPGIATTSTMALPSFVLSYSVETKVVECHYLSKEGGYAGAVRRESKQLDGGGFWDWFSAGHTEISGGIGGDGGGGGGPGWYGWWGYEMKEESLDGYRPKPAGQAISAGVDACWAWCPSVLRFEPSSRVHGSSEMAAATRVFLVDDDRNDAAAARQGGSSEMVRWLNELGVDWTRNEPLKEGPATTPTLSTPSLAFNTPCSASYIASIDACRQRIYAGDSYELTLTAPFVSSSALSRDESFAAYLALRSRNPAPYSTYLHLPTLQISILSSSPERFIRIHDGNVEMKPIKGTRARVRSADGSTYLQPDDTKVAQALANDPKERAENLMIVDLIRSDLHTCCHPESVRVPRLIALESYARVHQLVSTVQGKLADHISPVEAVKRCFPPGSMTGAPKLRSVEILETLESSPRGIYSGALGHMGLNGDIDLSVVIRTIVCTSQGLSIGGGGAITWLSDPESEWQEVLTKVHSVAKAFANPGSTTARLEPQTTPDVENR